MVDLSGEHPKSPSYEDIGSALINLDKVFIYAVIKISENEYYYYRDKLNNNKEGYKDEQYRRLMQFWGELAERFKSL